MGLESVLASLVLSVLDGSKFDPRLEATSCRIRRSLQKFSSSTPKTVCMERLSDSIQDRISTLSTLFENKQVRDCPLWG